MCVCICVLASFSFQYFENVELPEKVEGIAFFILMNVVIDGKYLGFAVGSQTLP